ncbi:hypothetical protein ABGB17_28400 [Sphaerisporangium sp. B11E5]|uniref:MmyB family transcriptional regulator n=1 Tax=Sphaerisporangium sp. B11E5 TaxID=3153563 RepID=UPI00325CBD1C
MCRRPAPCSRGCGPSAASTSAAGGVKRYRHPVIGELTVTYQAMAPPGEPDQTLMVYTVPPGSPDEQTLRRIVSWAENRKGPRRRRGGSAVDHSGAADRRPADRTSPERYGFSAPY